jgi:hypothetical protein
MMSLVRIVRPFAGTLFLVDVREQRGSTVEPVFALDLGIVATAHEPPVRTQGVPLSLFGPLKGRTPGRRLIEPAGAGPREPHFSREK